MNQYDRLISPIYGNKRNLYAFPWHGKPESRVRYTLLSFSYHSLTKAGRRACSALLLQK